eukprot:8931572-Pyramimonas_sp.AAC.1
MVHLLCPLVDPSKHSFADPLSPNHWCRTTALLNHCATDPLCYRPTALLTHCATDPLCFGPTVLPTHCATDRLRYRPTVLLTHCATDPLCYGPTALPTHCATDPLSYLPPQAAELHVAVPLPPVEAPYHNQPRLGQRRRLRFRPALRP